MLTVRWLVTALSCMAAAMGRRNQSHLAECLVRWVRVPAAFGWCWWWDAGLAGKDGAEDGVEEEAG